MSIFCLLPYWLKHFRAETFFLILFFTALCISCFLKALQETSKNRQKSQTGEVRGGWFGNSPRTLYRGITTFARPWTTNYLMQGCGAGSKSRLRSRLEIKVADTAWNQDCGAGLKSRLRSRLEINVADPAWNQGCGSGLKSRLRIRLEIKVADPAWNQRCGSGSKSRLRSRLEIKVTDPAWNWINPKLFKRKRIRIRSSRFRADLIKFTHITYLQNLM